MIDNETINTLIGVEESFHSSYKLLEIMSNEANRNNLFERFLEVESDLRYDWFLNYFQSEHSDRRNMKQDFTPNAVADIASKILGQSDSNLDMCSGTGGLTIKRYADNPSQTYCCEELSDRAIPFLLFNLAIRNVTGIVRHGNSLTREFKAIYKLSKGDKFSVIETIEEDIEIKAETIIMNPPYSLKWEADSKYLEEERFKLFEKLAPVSKADYAFILTGLHQLSDNGKMAIVLPHGVLFRGAAEETIRTKLIELNLIESIIGLPEKVFYNTDIPTVILVLKRNKQDNNIFFIDASDEYKKEAPKNLIEDKHIDKILKTYEAKTDIGRYSRSVSVEEIKENGFNLNLPRYIDKYIEESLPPLQDTLEELKQLDNETREASREFISLMKQLTSHNKEKEVELKNTVAYLEKREQTTIYDNLQTF